MKNTKKYIQILTATLGATLTSLAYAAEDPSQQTFNVNHWLKLPQQSTEYFTKGGLVAFITKIINILSQFVGVISILVIIVSGLLMMTSAGNENQLAKGKDGFKYAIIGIIISFSAYIITTFIQAVFFA